MAEAELVVPFREERFIESDPERISLIKIGEYVRTPLYEPSIRGMCIPMSEVRKQLLIDRKANKNFDAAWKAATKSFQVRSSFFKSKYKGADEYCIALICFTLGKPYTIYQEFKDLSQDLITNTWCYFPYKSLFYLIIQSEMRLLISDNIASEKGMKPIRHPITITTGLDYSIEEVDESEESSDALPQEESELSSMPRKIHTSSPMKKNSVFRTYIGLAFPLGDTEFQPRTLVAFNHIIPTTLDGVRLSKMLEDKNKRTTLIEIDQLSWSSRYIASISLFAMEKEVVLWPWVKFYVEERKMIHKNIEKILLKPTSQSFVNTRTQS